MKKLFKKVVASACILGTVASLASCSTGSSDSAEETHKIGIGIYTDTGRSVEALKSYVAGIEDDVNAEFVYVTLSTYDEATNKTKVQELISAGCEGIIMTADMGTTAILEECEKAGVYVGGFLCDYNNSYYTAYDDVFKSENFVGTVADGLIDQSAWGEQIANEIIENGYKNVGVLVFPAYAYPNQGLVDAKFRETIEAHNATVGADEKINLVDTIELNFSPLEATYLQDNPEIDAIFSVAAGASNVYPVLVAAGRTDIKLYTSGFEGTDDYENFGSNGNQCYQGVLFSTPEAIVYPLVQLIDKLNGKSFADAPSESERVNSSSISVTNDEDMQLVKEKSIYYTTDYANALISGEEVRNLCASFNENATYAGLVEAVNSLGLEDLRKAE